MTEINRINNCFWW